MRIKNKLRMKKTVLLLLWFPMVLSVSAQPAAKKEEAFYMLDANFKGTTQEKAVYFMHSVKESDSSWKFDTYNIAGPMISSEHYKDEKAGVLQGAAVYFNAKGTRDSAGNYYNGIPNGSFYYFNDTGRAYIQKEFSNGILLQTIDRIKKDSIDAAEWKRKKDTVKSLEIESEFPGGIGNWGKYLMHNLVYPQRAQNLEKQGTVVLQFIVDTQGHIYDQEIIRSVEYSLDQEALRIISTSPAWVPAFQNGRRVKSYKRQPLTFKLSRD
jgi:periplasmic protein TonB